MTILRPWTDRLLPLLGLAAGLAAWWAASATLWKNNPLMQGFSPKETGAAFAALFRSGEIWPHLWASLRRVLIGLGLAGLAGIPLGLLFGVLPRTEKLASAQFQLLRMISPLSWMPIAIVAFGVGDTPVLFLLAVAGVWPLMLNTTAGVAAVDPKMLLLARSLCATRWETIRRVILPSILPHVLTGLRLSMGIVWIVLVPAEMLGVRAGLGYYILDTRDRLAYSELAAVILIIGIIGYLLDAILRGAHQAWSHQD